MKRCSSVLLLTFVLAWSAGAVAGELSAGLKRQIAGMTGEQEIKVLVVMAEQADVAALDARLHTEKARLSVRHLTVIGALQDVSRRTQTALLSDLDSRKAAGAIRGYTPHWLVNGVVVVGTVDAIRELAARPDVAVVEPNLEVSLIEPVSRKPAGDKSADKGIGITPGLELIHADRVWREFGIRGAGVIVGTLDTGVDGTHPALSAQYRGNNGHPDSECWLDAAGLGDATPVDQHYHGTHTMGTICGLAPDDTIGVAPAAEWIASNVINMGTGTTFDNAVIASFEWMADPDGDAGTMDDVPDVVQNSWGVNEGFTGYYDCDSRWWAAIDNCEAAGVCVTWSAGNEGPSSTSLRSPADRAETPYNCFSVGATTTNDPPSISDFSSRGPSGCGGAFATKPEVAAPGEDIYSAQPGGGYQYLSGTSMAGPHVAGVVALMRCANPDLDVTTIKQVLMDTAVDYGDPGEDNTWGHGLIDAYQAVLFVMGGIGTVQGTVTDADTGLPLAGVTVHDVGGYASMVTGADGTYSFMLTAEDHTLEYGAFGYDTQQVTVTVVEDVVTTQDVALATSPLTRLYGYVFAAADNSFVEGAEISLVGHVWPAAATGPDGMYEMYLPAGATYTVRAAKPGFDAASQTFAFTGEKVVNFHLPALSTEDWEWGTMDVWPWSVSGNADWYLDGDAYEGDYAARSGDITDGQSSTLEVTVDVPEGVLSFFYKVSSESGYDYLRFYVDGTEKNAWSGSIGWTQASYPVSAGSHTFTWTYSKDGSVSSGSDAAWVDLIRFPNGGTEPTPQMAMDFTAITFNVAPGGTGVQGKYLGNTGTANLSYALGLMLPEGPTFAPPPAVRPQLPILDLAKGEIDPRPGQPPLLGAGGPDDFGYRWADSDEPGGPTYGWVEINGLGASLPGDDDGNYGPYNLGFTFSYYGTDYTAVRVCTNGWLSFTSTSEAYSNSTIPGTGEPNALVAPFWDDMNNLAGGTIYYYADPAGQFIVEWDAVQHYSSGDPETYQVILRPSGEIVFQYKTLSAPTSCTVGIENQAGDDGLQVVYNAAYLHDAMAIRFSAEPPVPWLSVEPDAGTVPPGQHRQFNLHYDATELAAGTYEAVLMCGSNDPADPLVEIPIVLTVGDVSGVDDGLPRNRLSLRADPNPFNPMTQISFRVPAAGRVDLQVFDVAGRLVRTLVGDHRDAGSYTVTWTGTDDHGRAVASGTYYARLAVGGVGHRVTSLVLVR